MVGRAVMAVAAMAEEATAAVAAGLTEAGAVVVLVVEVAVAAALDEAGVVLSAGDVELLQLRRSACVFMHTVAGVFD